MKSAHGWSCTKSCTHFATSSSRIYGPIMTIQNNRIARFRFFYRNLNVRFNPMWNCSFSIVFWIYLVECLVRSPYQFHHRRMRIFSKFFKNSLSSNNLSLNMRCTHSIQFIRKQSRESYCNSLSWLRQQEQCIWILIMWWVLVDEYVIDDEVSCCGIIGVAEVCIKLSLTAEYNFNAAADAHTNDS